MPHLPRLQFVTCSLLAAAALPGQYVLQHGSDFVPRPAAAVAFDPNTGDGILFGGGQGTNWRNDTWRHDAGRWLPVTTAHQPPAVANPIACTWPGHGVLLVVGTQNWVFDGVDWHPLATSHQPAQVLVMAFDDARQVAVAITPGTVGLPSGLWEFDGVDWTERTVTMSAPPVLAVMRMAFDPTSQRCLARVCNYPISANGTYAWDGSAWSVLGIGGSCARGFLLATAPAQMGLLQSGGIHDPGEVSWPSFAIPYSSLEGPGAPARRDHCVGWYDPNRDRTVVTACHGNNLGTWYLDASGWSQPSAGRRLPGWVRTLTYDAWGGRMLTSCGYHYFSVEPINETWSVRDGELEMLGPGPVPRFDHGMAFDSRRGRLIVFGGATHVYGGGHDTTFFQDGGVVNEWDGQTWTTVPTQPTDPRYRTRPAMAFDRARGRTVLFGGGLLGSGIPVWQSDTWEWDGLAWTPMQPTTTPTADEGELFFDVDLQQCVLRVGGAFWAWSGADWLPLAIPTQPAAGRFAYDAARGVYLLLPTAGGGVHELHNGAWQFVPGPTVASGFALHALAFDPSRGLFVGADDRDTFTYGDPAAAWVRPSGAGCAGSTGVPRLVGEDPPRLGRTIHLRVTAAPAAAPWFGMLGADTGSYLGQPLPIDLTIAGMPACALHTAIDAFELRATGDWSIAIPNQPLLLGQRFTAQAFVFDATANTLGATTSNGVLLRIGQ